MHGLSIVEIIALFFLILGFSIYVYVMRIAIKRPNPEPARKLRAKKKVEAPKKFPFIGVPKEKGEREEAKEEKLPLFVSLAEKMVQKVKEEKEGEQK